MNSKAYKTYEISKNEYYELKYFCLQYHEKKAKLTGLYGIHAVNYSGTNIRGSGISNPTERTALAAIRLASDLDIIDKALDRTAAEPMRAYLKRSVTTNVRYEQLGIPMGRQQFYELRRKFFYTLKNLKWDNKCCQNM